MEQTIASWSMVKVHGLMAAYSGLELELVRLWARELAEPHVEARAPTALLLRGEKRKVVQDGAYKRGDQDAVRRIQRKLDALAPEKADAGPRHPWA